MNLLGTRPREGVTAPGWRVPREAPRTHPGTAAVPLRRTARVPPALRQAPRPPAATGTSPTWDGDSWAGWVRAGWGHGAPEAPVGGMWARNLPEASRGCDEPCGTAPQEQMEPNSKAHPVALGGVTAQPPQVGGCSPIAVSSAWGNPTEVGSSVGDISPDAVPTAEVTAPLSPPTMHGALTRGQDTWRATLGTHGIAGAMCLPPHTVPLAQMLCAGASLSPLITNPPLHH